MGSGAIQFLSTVLEEPLSKCAFSHFQIAQNGIWENALEVFPRSFDKKYRDLQTSIPKFDRDIAIEAFFGDKKTDDFFFIGVRIECLDKEEQYKFLMALFEHIKIIKTYQDFMRVLKTVSSEPLMTGNPDLMELGAEGFWASYGSCVVWQSGSDEVYGYSDLQEIVPHLLEPFERPIMLEYAWKTPYPSWVGVPVSRKNKHSFQCNEDRYNAFTKHVAIF